MYYLHLAYLSHSHHGSREPQGDLITSTPEKDINEWLLKNHLRNLSQWEFKALTGSNAPQDRGAMNTLHFDPAHKNPLEGTLIISVYEIVPVEDATKIF